MSGSAPSRSAWHGIGQVPQWTPTGCRSAHPWHQPTLLRRSALDLACGCRPRGWESGMLPRLQGLLSNNPPHRCFSKYITWGSLMLRTNGFPRRASARATSVRRQSLRHRCRMLGLIHGLLCRAMVTIVMLQPMSLPLRGATHAADLFFLRLSPAFAPSLPRTSMLSASTNISLTNMSCPLQSGSPVSKTSPCSLPLGR